MSFESTETKAYLVTTVLGEERRIAQILIPPKAIAAARLAIHRALLADYALARRMYEIPAVRTSLEDAHGALQRIGSLNDLSLYGIPAQEFDLRAEGVPGSPSADLIDGENLGGISDSERVDTVATGLIEYCGASGLEVERVYMDPVQFQDHITDINRGRREEMFRAISGV